MPSVELTAPTTSNGPARRSVSCNQRPAAHQRAPDRHVHEEPHPPRQPPREHPPKHQPETGGHPRNGAINCTNLRLPTAGGLCAWEFEKTRRELKVRVEGQLVSNNPAISLRAAEAGLGLAYLPEDRVQDHLADGRLLRVLADWCPPFPGYHLYYPSRRQPTPAFTLLVEALRHPNSTRQA